MIYIEEAHATDEWSIGYSTGVLNRKHQTNTFQVYHLYRQCQVETLEYFWTRKHADSRAN